MKTFLECLIRNNIKSGCLTTVSNHLSREIRELYSREHELPRNVIIADTVMVPVTERDQKKSGRMGKGERTGL